MGKRLTNDLLSVNLGLVIGDRRSGKSTLFAYIADAFLNAGYPVYCQYLDKGCYQIPLIESTVNGVRRYDVDKVWLYSANLSGCCVLLDEGKTIWPARSYSKWTVADEDFINFLGKDDTYLFVATQASDCLDINLRRAADRTYHLTLGFWHFSHIESSKTTLAKVADTNTEVLGRAFRRGMRKVVWDVVEAPYGNYWFWRRKWYNKFVSTHTFQDKPFVEAPMWDEIFDFESAQSEQRYVSPSSLSEIWNEYFSPSSDYDDSDEEEIMSDEEFFNNDYDYEEVTEEAMNFDNIPQNLIRFVGKIKRSRESKERILQNIKNRFKGQNNENKEE